jgi:hypothetical protein
VVATVLPFHDAAAAEPPEVVLIPVKSTVPLVTGPVMRAIVVRDPPGEEDEEEYSIVPWFVLWKFPVQFVITRRLAAIWLVDKNVFDGGIEI